jgi:acetoacetyl-CoA synthetase
MLVLFVVLAPGSDLTPALEDQLRTSLRRELSPRHVPDRIVAVAGVPRTLSGKKLEVPVKRILQGEDPDRVVSRESLADPGALDAFVELAGRLGERP